MASNVPYVLDVPTYNPAIGTAPFTLDQVPPGTTVFKWTLNTGDDGLPADAPNYSGKSVTAEGTFAASTVTVEGRDGYAGNWQALHNAAGGAAITFTADGKAQILEDVRQVRFRVTAGAAVGLICRLIVVTPARR